MTNATLKSDKACDAQFEQERAHLQAPASAPDTLCQLLHTPGELLFGSPLLCTDAEYSASARGDRALSDEASPQRPKLGGGGNAMPGDCAPRADDCDTTAAQRETLILRAEVQSLHDELEARAAAHAATTDVLRERSAALTQANAARRGLQDALANAHAAIAGLEQFAQGALTRFSASAAAVKRTDETEEGVSAALDAFAGGLTRSLDEISSDATAHHRLAEAALQQATLQLSEEENCAALVQTECVRLSQLYDAEVAQRLSLGQQLAAREAERELAHTQIASSQAQCAELAKQLRAARLRLTAAAESAHEQCTTIDKLRAAARAAETLQDTSNEQLAEARAANAKLLHERQQAQVRLLAADARLDELQRLQRAASEQAAAANAELGKAQHQVRMMRTQADAAERAQTQLGQQSDEHAHAARTAEDELAAARSEVATLQNRMDESKSCVNLLQLQLQEAGAERETAMAAADALRSNAIQAEQSLRAQLEAMRSQAAETEHFAQARLDAVHAQLAAESTEQTTLVDVRTVDENRICSVAHNSVLACAASLSSSYQCSIHKARSVTCWRCNNYVSKPIKCYAGAAASAAR